MVFECGSGNIGRGIPIRSTTGANGEEALEHALRQGGPGTLDKTIGADWIGRLSWFPKLLLTLSLCLLWDKKRWLAG